MYIQDLQPAPNSAKTVCATIKAVIRENDSTKEINSPTFGKILRTKAVPVQSVCPLGL